MVFRRIHSFFISVSAVISDLFVSDFMMFSKLLKENRKNRPRSGAVIMQLIDYFTMLATSAAKSS